MTHLTHDALPPELVDFAETWVGPGWSVSPVTGDASIRSYYRLRCSSGEQYILAYYPEAIRESMDRFLAAYRSLEERGCVPAVFRSSGSVIAQADVGDRTLMSILTDDAVEGRRLYREAIDLLVSLQSAGGEAGEINPPFDAARFRSELEMTREFYVERLSGFAVSPRLEVLFDELADRLSSHPYVLTHRDFHGQNIHVVNDRLYVIDYQDMRMGPDTYDLASLLRDRGVWQRLGRSAEEELIGYYRQLSGASGDLRRRYLENLLQRSIKAIGTFAKMAIVRDLHHYLEYIPPTLASVEHAINELGELGELRELFPMTFNAAGGRRT